MDHELSGLEDILAYKFKNKELLLQAVTHSSYANEKYGDASKDNERLEFLGDAVLDMVISNMLFLSESRSAEGVLTKLRAAVVCEKSLAQISREKGFNEYLLLGRGELLSCGKDRDSIIADGVEALIGAIYLDGGYARASEVIKALFKDVVSRAEKGLLAKDSKTELQERLQANGPCDIVYRMIDEFGPDHDKTFSFAVFASGRQLGTGSGKSKKEAQAQAAENALANL